MNIASIVRSDFEPYGAAKLDQQRLPRPLTRSAGGIASNATQAVEEQKVVAVFVGCNKLLEAIDQLRPHDSAFGQSIKIERHKLRIELSFVIARLGSD